MTTRTNDHRPARGRGARDALLVGNAVPAGRQVDHDPLTSIEQRRDTPLANATGEAIRDRESPLNPLSSLYDTVA